MRRAFTLAVAILGIHAGIAIGARWSEVGTGLVGTVPGIRTLAIDRSNGSTLYAVSSRGSIFKTTNGGANWKALGNLVGVQVLALDPGSTGTIYAGTNRGLFKSTDAGESWTAAGLSGTSITAVVVDPVKPSNVYLGGDGDHVYKSTDGGGNWTAFSVGIRNLAAAPFGGITSITIDPLTPSTLYVVNPVPGFELYRSEDGGESWRLIDRGAFGRLLAIAPTAPSTLYATRAPSGLSRSTDGGASWTATGMTKDVLAMAIDPANSATLFAAISGPNQTGQGIYKSNDGGQNWNPVNTSIPASGTLVVSPGNSSAVYAATFTAGVFKSADAGANWSEADTGLRSLGIQALVADPVDPAAIYAAADEGLFKSVDGGASWNLQAAFQVNAGAPPPGLPPPLTPIPGAARAGVNSLLIDFENPNILYVAAQRVDGCFFTDINLFKSTDWGANWDDSITPKQSGCLADRLMGMDPTDPGILYLRYGSVFDGYGLLKSTNGGATWNFTGLSADAVNVLAIDPANPSNLFVGTYGGVLRSTDGGATWKMAGLARANVNLLVMDPIQTDVFYAGLSGVYPETPGSRGLVKSTDGGANWSPVNEGLEDVVGTHAAMNALIVDPDRPNVLYAAISGYGVFKSSDGGRGWASFNDGLANLDVRTVAVGRGPLRTVYAGTPDGVFRIVDDGN